MSGPSPLPLTDRERFEVWITRPGAYSRKDLARCDSDSIAAGEYRNTRIEADWNVWRAAVESAVRASLLVPPEDVVHQGIGPSTVERGASNTVGADAPPIAEKCPDGLLPDGETCPRCGGRRGPSGVGGGTWVHYAGASGAPRREE